MISFIVTGFGPFRDASENPSMMVVNDLVNYLRSSDDESLAAATNTIIIETSADAARKQIDAIHAGIASEKAEGVDRPVVVLLNLGVNYCGKNFQLEKCAYNEATFRMPDERGWSPQNICVVKGTLGASISTPLDVDELVVQMNNTATTSCSTEHSDQGVLALASVDPGRFVCNYTYCYGLNKFKPSLQDNSPDVRCLFLHVPPFAVCPKHTQLRFVKKLMKAIAFQVHREHRIKTKM